MDLDTREFNNSLASTEFLHKVTTERLGYQTLQTCKKLKNVKHITEYVVYWHVATFTTTDVNVQQTEEGAKEDS